ncbi:MarR family winged helix-turn-helix transcriptional regulator [Streptomyces sp. 7-21]|uniref:MarR family winged helix-turn-helix transcriptional regulator n=1 Tax=Streptomyces sp. 7-21 TaxID=2802283 RepID=UPI00191DBC7C|nr:MarR family winged helix-turn-helix transcriptional regulator [Streptomyces sp. 7-21]MBL1068832.1 winged helix-turn-helix transcriptional regulator [Streptomyces sp. 7-21]
MTGDSAGFSGLGTRLRHLLELLEGGVAAAGEEFGLPAGTRPRFSPVIRALHALGPLPIRDLAGALGVTHSAASQTVAQMRARGLVELRPGSDARQRLVSLTGGARALLPALAAEWEAVAAAQARLDAELPCPLDEVVTAAIRALEREPFAERIVRAAHQQAGDAGDAGDSAEGER